MHLDVTFSKSDFRVRFRGGSFFRPRVSFEIPIMDDLILEPTECSLCEIISIDGPKCAFIGNRSRSQICIRGNNVTGGNSTIRVMLTSSVSHQGGVNDHHLGVNIEWCEPRFTFLTVHTRARTHTHTHTHMHTCTQTQVYIQSFE